MLVDSLINPQTLIQPRSFAGLMTLYESNFIRLLQLMPDLETLPDNGHDGWLSQVDGDCDLRIGVLERARYTTTLNMTYLFTDNDGPLSAPDLRLRVYLDGRLAEAMSFGGLECHPVLKDIARRHKLELDKRWARNIMLNKWLEYCCDLGHRIG